MKIDGCCHCGEITFEAQVEAATFGICHCDDCQVLSGSAFRAVVQAPADHFKIRGTPKTYLKTTTPSGNKSLSAFCGNCGSSIYSCAAIDNPPVYRLRLGVITQRAAFSPRRQIWRKRAFPWIEDLSSVPADEENPPA
jgi:hypothetical protein